MPVLSYVPFERLAVQRPVNRIEFVTERCRGRVVLDVGCYDETALAKRGTRHWLHGAIAEVARKVVGLDTSEQLPLEGLVTGPNSRVFRGSATRLREFPLDDRVETIVAGELIEHLEDPLAFLRDIKLLFPRREMLVTTPNSTSLANVLLGLSDRESSHADHLGVFSYKTLNTLSLRAEFQDWEIVPYRVSFTELAMRSRGLRRSLVNLGERVVNMGEHMFPLLSGGLILHVRSI